MGDSIRQTEHGYEVVTDTGDVVALCYSSDAAEAIVSGAALRAAVEQAVTLYEILRTEADDGDDVQGENFWEGHRNAALAALGRFQEGQRIAADALGKIGAEP